MDVAIVDVARDEEQQNTYWFTIILLRRHTESAEYAILDRLRSTQICFRLVWTGSDTVRGAQPKESEEGPAKESSVRRAYYYYYIRELLLPYG